jgi:hypothetical protein
MRRELHSLQIDRKKMAMLKNIKQYIHIEQLFLRRD